MTRILFIPRIRFLVLQREKVKEDKEKQDKRGKEKWYVKSLEVYKIVIYFEIVLRESKVLSFGILWCFRISLPKIEWLFLDGEAPFWNKPSQPLNLILH